LIISKKDLKEIQADFRHIFDNAPYSILLIDTDGIILEINPATESLIGYERNELISKNYLKFQIYSEKNKSIIRKRFQRILNGQVIKPIDVKFYKKDGTPIWINLLTSLIVYSEKTYIQVIMQDINERKVMENRLKESEEKYRNLISNLIDIIVEIDFDGTITFLSPQIYKILGYREDELIGTNGFDLVHPDDVNFVKNKIQRAVVTGEIVSYEHRVKHKNGDYIPIAAIGTLVSTNNQYKVVGVLRDITDKKRIEQGLKESEEKFRSITEQSLMAVGILQDDEIKYINQRAQEISGYKLEEIKNWKPGEIYKVIHPDDKALVVEQAKKKQKGDKEIIKNYRFRLIKKNKKTLWVEIYSKTINYNGKPADLFTMIDISQLKEYEEKQRELDQIRKDFINTASHELKNPLTAINGACQLLKKFYSNKIDSEMDDLINIILRAGKRMKNLINELINTSRVDSGKAKLIKTKENLIKLVNNYLHDIKYLIKERELNIIKDFQEDIQIYIDRDMIEEVFANLMSNAIKFTPPKGDIIIKIQKINNSVDLSIKDTGVGLTKEEIKKLFHKFSRIKRDSSKFDIISEGTGLGLYITKKIVEMHKGEIIVKSEGRNRGSTFIVKLPIM